MEKYHNTNSNTIWVEFEEDPWIISDTHFFHRNIIKYTGRPFETVTEMNEAIVKNWNDCVGKDDLILHLGDFGLSSSRNLEKIIKRLKGIKWIIIGNHDRSRNWYVSRGFDRAVKKPLETRDYIFSHRPILPCKKINIHGHMHQKRMRKRGYINASVEHIDYRPIKLSDLIKKFADRI